jgi:hypothetical protein
MGSLCGVLASLAAARTPQHRAGAGPGHGQTNPPAEGAQPAAALRFYIYGTDRGGALENNEPLDATRHPPPPPCAMRQAQAPPASPPAPP